MPTGIPAKTQPPKPFGAVRKASALARYRGNGRIRSKAMVAIVQHAAAQLGRHHGLMLEQQQLRSLQLRHRDGTAFGIEKLDLINIRR
jgi:hypothetical protein